MHNSRHGTRGLELPIWVHKLGCKQRCFWEMTLVQGSSWLAGCNVVKKKMLQLGKTLLALVRDYEDRNYRMDLKDTLCERSRPSGTEKIRRACMRLNHCPSSERERKTEVYVDNDRERWVCEIQISNEGAWPVELSCTSGWCALRNWSCFTWMTIG